MAARGRGRPKRAPSAKPPQRPKNITQLPNGTVGFRGYRPAARKATPGLGRAALTAAANVGAAVHASRAPLPPMIRLPLAAASAAGALPRQAPRAPKRRRTQPRIFR